jgi:TrmH family RNA methyltransferase
MIGPHRVRFVLLHPRSGGNVGAVARALKNFGHRHAAIVGDEAFDADHARMMAVQSEEVLESMPRFATLDEAVADCAWVVGTSPRRRRGMRTLSIRAFAEEAASRLASGSVALVFGEERSGLSNEQLERCHDLSAIDTDPAQPSVNLAQAVLLYAYELRAATMGARPAETGPTAATDGELQGLRSGLEQLLGDAGFLTHDPRPALGGLLATLERARLTRDEARLWRAALASAVKALGGRSSVEAEA